MQWIFAFIRNLSALKFYFKSVLVNLFGKATPEFTVNSHCRTYNLMCLHSTCINHRP